jgi:putative FmdB family regulatory protein
MAAYDYHCRTCDSVFEVRRSVTAEGGGVLCPDGHDEVSRVWSAVALASGNATQPRREAPASGGCCGGGCCAGAG